MKFVCIMCGTEVDGANLPEACPACGAGEFTGCLENIDELSNDFSVDVVVGACRLIGKRSFSLGEFMQLFQGLMKRDDQEKEACTDTLCDLICETALFDGLAKKNGVFREMGISIRHSYRDKNKTRMICDCMVVAEFARKRRKLATK